MIRKLLVLALLAPLGSCEDRQEPLPPPIHVGKPRPVVIGQRDPDWLSAVPECEGRLQRGEWLVCDNKNLNWLHRTLATQWAEERQGADRQRLHVQRQQLRALLSERASCADVPCVANAYRRYLGVRYTPPAPPAPHPRWTPPPRKPHPPRHPHRPQHGQGWNWRDNGPTCTGQIGWSAAATLARQCEIVNPDGQCAPERSCGVLKTMIREGCWDQDGRRPGFCNRR
jgi:hypothetical protein